MSSIFGADGKIVVWMSIPKREECEWNMENYVECEFWWWWKEEENEKRAKESVAMSAERGKLSKVGKKIIVKKKYNIFFYKEALCAYCEILTYCDKNKQQYKKNKKSYASETKIKREQKKPPSLITYSSLCIVSFFLFLLFSVLILFPLCLCWVCVVCEVLSASIFLHLIIALMK